MTLAIFTIEIALLLIYAGIKGKSVTQLLLGNSTDQPNQSVAQ